MRGDLVEFLSEGDPFVPKGTLGNVVASGWHSGQRAYMVRCEWHNDTLSFVQPREVRVIAHGAAIEASRVPPEMVVPYTIDIEGKTITGVK